MKKVEFIQLSMLPGYVPVAPAFHFVRSAALQTATRAKLKRAECQIRDIEDQIEDLKRERNRVENEIEELEIELANAIKCDTPEMPFPPQLFQDGLTWPEREFLDRVATDGTSDDRDEYRLRSILQNHSGWQDRINTNL